MARRHLTKEQRVLEICLIIVSVGLACLFHAYDGYKMVVLNLFQLPVVLTAFVLGRYRAGLLALFCFISVSVVAVLDVNMVSYYTRSPLVAALAIAVWGAILGLTALLVGNLSEERQKKTAELHEAYVGVVEVLSQHLQSANPCMKARSIRVAELAQQVAAEMKLSAKQIDDVRVAALLYDVGNVEITSRVIRRAMGTIGADAAGGTPHTFQGRELVLSLGSVLSGAMPLLLDQSHAEGATADGDRSQSLRDVPVGARVIRVVRDYDELTTSQISGPTLTPQEALRDLVEDTSAGYDVNVLKALQRRIEHLDQSQEPELQLTS